MHRQLTPFLLLAAASLAAACGDETGPDGRPTDTGATPPAEAAPADPGPLARTLKAKADAGAAKAPDAVKAVMAEAAAEIAALGLESRALQVGARAPDFTLEDGLGVEHALNDLRKEGPVVVTFYRGKW